MSVRYVQMGHHTFRVEADDFAQDPKVTITKSTPEQYADDTLLDRVNNQVVGSVDNAVKEAVNEMKQSFKADIKKIAMGILGFDKGWGQWQVDHCNGRMSELSAYVNEEMRQFMKNELVIDYTKLFSKEEIDELKAGIKKDMRDNMARQMREEIYGQARVASKRVVQETIEEVLQEQRKALAAQVVEQFVGVKLK